MRWWESLHAAQLTLTYYVQVGGIGRSRVALHPGWGACLHVDERGPKTVDVCFCGMAPTQNDLGAHVYLKKTRKALFICPSSPCPVLEATSLPLWYLLHALAFRENATAVSILQAKENANTFSGVRMIWMEPSLQYDKEQPFPWTEHTTDLMPKV